MKSFSGWLVLNTIIITMFYLLNKYQILLAEFSTIWQYSVLNFMYGFYCLIEKIAEVKYK